MDWELHSSWLVVNILLFLGGLWILIKGSDIFIDASADIARRFRVSELAIGLTLVSIGTSLPELASSLYAAFCNQPEFIVGNIVGSITTNITLMLGLGALIGGSLCFSRRLLTRDAVFMFLVFLLTVLLTVLTRVPGNSGVPEPGINRWGGLLLLVLAVWYCRSLLRNSDPDTSREEEREDQAADVAESTENPPSPPSAARCFGLAALGLFMVIVGSKLLVDNVVWGAEKLGISTMIISVTVVAFGTSVPELAVTLAGVLKNRHDLAVGNIIGSCTFNILMIFGACALVRPLEIAGIDGAVNLALMVGAGVALLGCMATGGRLNRVHGVVLLLLYVGFLIYNCRILLGVV